MRVKRTPLFLGLCIALVYCVCIGELVFTTQYLQSLKAHSQEQNQKYFQIENKYLIALGEDSPVEGIAQAYLEEQIIPQLFVKCKQGYYTIMHNRESQYIPPTINKWYEHLYKQGSYRYYSTYTVSAYAGLKYETLIEEQTDSHIIVKIKMLTLDMASGNWYYTNSFDAYVNYAFEVDKIDGAGNDQLPVYGKGILPKGYTCEYLQANYGTRIK